MRRIWCGWTVTPADVVTDAVKGNTKMQPARGDRRPCTCTGCTGTMQFGRESDNAREHSDVSVPRGVTPQDPTGWVCSADPMHFLHAS